MSRPDTSRTVHFRKPPEHHWHLGIVAKRVYRFQDGACTLHESQLPLLGEDDPSLGDARDKDDYPYKPVTDVVLHGAVHAGRQVVELVASLTVGAVGRSVRVFGDRIVERLHGETVAAFSAPKPFSTMPLTYARSYGGLDRYAATKLGDEGVSMSAAAAIDLAAASRFTYPRNARGVGFTIAVDARRVLGTVVPNLEDPDDPVLPERLLCQDPDRWFEQPIPGALDYVEYADFPRSLFFNLDPELPNPPPALREVALGAVSPGDLRPRNLFEPPDARAANGAAPGLARVRLRGDEPVRLSHLHRTRRELVFDLPREVPELRIQPPGCPAMEVEAALDTIYLEPEHDRVSLIWSGSLQVAGRYPSEELSAVAHQVRWP